MPDASSIESLRDEAREQLGRALSFRIPPSLAERAERAAARELISVSDYARRALLRELDARAEQGRP